MYSIKPAMLWWIAVGLMHYGVHCAEEYSGWCNPNPRICVSGSLINDTRVEFKLSGPRNAGYVALGIGKGMDSADIYMIYEDNKTIQLDYLQSTGHTIPKLSSDNDLTWNTTTTVTTNDANKVSENDVISVLFQRNLDKSTVRLMDLSSSENTTFLWAYSAVKPSTRGAFTRHTSRGVFSLLISNNLLSGHKDTRTDETIKESLEDLSVEEEVSEEDEERVAQTILIHGTLMMVAWVGLPPVGVFVARYMKPVLGAWWFRTHIFIFTLVGVLSIIGVSFIGMEMGNVLDNPHAIIGATVLTLYLAQISLGIVIDQLYNSLRTEVPWYDMAHWWLGRSSIVLATINVVSGISMMENSVGWWAGFLLLMFSNLLLFMLGSTAYPVESHSKPLIIEKIDRNEGAISYYQSQQKQLLIMQQEQQQQKNNTNNDTTNLLSLHSTQEASSSKARLIPIDTNLENNNTKD